MLLYMSYNSDIKSVLNITPQRLRVLRRYIVTRTMSYESVADMLVRLGCRLIRPRVELPCIVKDKNGRLFDEYTFVKMFFTPEIAERYHADYRKTLAVAEANKSINRPLFKHILKKRRAWIILDNMILDAIWSYEPIELTMTEEKVIQVRGMLAENVPSSDNPLDVLTYQRPAPVLERPNEECESQTTTTQENP